VLAPVHAHVHLPAHALGKPSAGGELLTRHGHLDRTSSTREGVLTCNKECFINVSEDKSSFHTVEAPPQLRD
jgi:hypothetical protein